MLAVLPLVALFPVLVATAQSFFPLPRPRVPRVMSFEDVLNRIRTDRDYSPRPLRIVDLSYVLWAAGGGRFDADAVNGASRTYPSAFEMYPVRLYLLVGAVEGFKPGIYQYLPVGHRLKRLKEGDHRKESVKGSMYGGFVARAPATVVLAADSGPMSAMFGERGRGLYLPLEVGHLSQTLRLAAASAGISVGIVGAFHHGRIKCLLGIQEEPLLLLPLGYSP